MNCPQCSHENKAGRKFCAECGSALVVVCPKCSAPSEQGEKFCGECGQHLTNVTVETPQITTSHAPLATPSAERRLVSILFVDLVGFTAFAEGRDTEEIRENLNRYFELATEVITHHGGVVEKFIGDAVMAVWGAPTAHEDDAERCVRAALELIDALGVLGAGITARAGVLTGETAVTIGAINQGMVAGDIVNTATRLQSVAEPGTVLVGESTMRAASLGIAFEPAGVQMLKGKVTPVPAWRAVRVVAEVGGARTYRHVGSTVCRPRRGSPTAERPLLRHRARGANQIGVHHGHRGDWQEPLDVGIREVHRRSRPDGVVAPRPVPRPRRWGRPLGPW